MPVIMRIFHGSRPDPGAKSDLLPTPQVVRDHLDDMISPIDGKPQTSKRAYYRQLRQSGCEVNPEATIRDHNAPEQGPDGLKADIAAALRDLKGQ